MGKPPTIAEGIQAKAERLNKWYEANPQFDKADDGATTDEPMYVPRSMSPSPAFRSLSRVAIQILLDFYHKRDMRSFGHTRTPDGQKKKRYECVNNGQIIYPYSEAEANGFSRVQFRNAIDELQCKGFIDITHLGVGGRKPQNGEGDANMYFLDKRWQDFDEVQQVAVRPPRNPRKKDSRGDRGFQQFWDNVRTLATILFVQMRCKQILGIENDTSLALNQYRKRYQLGQKGTEAAGYPKRPQSHYQKAAAPKNRLSETGIENDTILKNLQAPYSERGGKTMPQTSTDLDNGHLTMAPASNDQSAYAPGR
jgi:hypothetical protein